MPTSSKPFPQNVILLTEYGDGGDFGDFLEAGLAANGCQVTRIGDRNPWVGKPELILGYGPFTYNHGNLETAVRRLAQMAPEHRPVFVWWLTENRPDPRIPEFLVKPLSALRTGLDHILERQRDRIPATWSEPLLRAHRLRVFGQLRSARQAGVLDVLAITSQTRASFYRRQGFNPMVAPLGYHPIYGVDLGLERDISVVFLGQVEDRRRQRLLPPLVARLAGQGVSVVAPDRIYGDERTNLLNRSRVMLNILRAPQDFVGQRLVYAAANKTLLISEPMEDPHPFVPGKHFVMAPLDRLEQTILKYLNDEPERQRITNQAYRFVTQELRIDQMVGRVLQAAWSVKNDREAYG